MALRSTDPNYALMQAQDVMLISRARKARLISLVEADMYSAIVIRRGRLMPLQVLCLMNKLHEASVVRFTDSIPPWRVDDKLDLEQPIANRADDLPAPLAYKALNSLLDRGIYLAESADN